MRKMRNDIYLQSYFTQVYINEKSFFVIEIHAQLLQVAQREKILGSSHLYMIPLSGSKPHVEGLHQRSI